MYDVLILGAGIHGLCTAFHLRRRGLCIAVLDRHAAGHAHGGSHGSSRIIRSSYSDRRYVELAQHAYRDGWQLLEAELGVSLVHRTPGLFFGPPEGPFGAFLEATLAAGVAVEQIEGQAARRAFPLLRIEDDDAVLLDHTAGVLAAADTMAALRAWLVAHGVELHDGAAATAIGSTPEAVEVVTAEGTLRAQSVVVATGAWIGDLLPAWRSQLVPLRQQVGYVQVQATAAATQVGAFPVWCRIGHGAAFDYGLPEFGRPGLKIARHRTQGLGDDPDTETPAIDEDALLALASSRFTAPVERLLGSEHCLYAVAPGEQLHVERDPGDRRIVVVAACSGHGFKFGPVLGARAAELASTP